ARHEADHDDDPDDHQQPDHRTPSAQARFLRVVELLLQQQLVFQLRQVDVAHLLEILLGDPGCREVTAHGTPIRQSTPWVVVSWVPPLLITAGALPSPTWIAEPLRLQT